jgi:hypothetical protein
LQRRAVDRVAVSHLLWALHGDMECLLAKEGWISLILGSISH